MSTGDNCFRPGGEDGELTAQQARPGGGGGALCFHPGDDDGASITCLADDLAADLHLALTGIDDRHLAVLV